MFYKRSNWFSKLLQMGRVTYSLSIASTPRLKGNVRNSKRFSSSKDNDQLILNPLVICGPSGCGKSSLLNKLFADYPNCFGFSVSHSTRKPRPGEEDGVHYHFSTFEAMEEGMSKGIFVEHATFSGNMYGTSKQAVEAVREMGKICVLDIEVQGVQQVKKTDLNAVFIFVRPPSVEALEERLRNRGTETEESLKLRLGRAANEMEYGTEDNFDLVVVNDELERAYEEMKEFLRCVYNLEDCKK